MYMVVAVLSVSVTSGSVLVRDMMKDWVSSNTSSLMTMILTQPKSGASKGMAMSVETSV